MLRTFPRSQLGGGTRRVLARTPLLNQRTRPPPALLAIHPGRYFFERTTVLAPHGVPQCCLGAARLASGSLFQALARRPTLEDPRGVPPPYLLFFKNILTGLGGAHTRPGSVCAAPCASGGTRCRCQAGQQVAALRDPARHNHRLISNISSRVDGREAPRRTRAVSRLLI